MAFLAGPAGFGRSLHVQWVTCALVLAAVAASALAPGIARAGDVNVDITANFNVSVPLACAVEEEEQGWSYHAIDVSPPYYSFEEFIACKNWNRNLEGNHPW